MESLTTSKLRANIYNIFDQALESGQAIEVTRKGKKLRIVPEHTVLKTQRITPWPDAIVGDAQDLAKISWEDEWNGSIE